jgi:hypothetical protein
MGWSLELEFILSVFLSSFLFWGRHPIRAGKGGGDSDPEETHGRVLQSRQPACGDGKKCSEPNRSVTRTTWASQSAECYWNIGTDLYQGISASVAGFLPGADFRSLWESRDGRVCLAELPPSPAGSTSNFWLLF